MTSSSRPPSPLSRTVRAETEAVVTEPKTCAHPSCERPAALNPPYCCVPCEVNAGHPGPEHLHSVTCEKDNPDA